jgi:hypothetical protein
VKSAVTPPAVAVTLAVPGLSSHTRESPALNPLPEPLQIDPDAFDYLKAHRR